MEQQASPRESPGSRTGPRRAPASQAPRPHDVGRLAAAAFDAFAGLHGLPGAAATPTRSPGVGLLFDAEVVAPPGRSCLDDAADAADAADADEAEHDADSATVGHPDDGTAPPVWNPFRTVRRVESGGRADRATISHLHVRRSDTGVMVIATVSYQGRLAHGTASGVVDRAGVVRAVAEATVAALGTLAGGSLQAIVTEVAMTRAGAPSTVVLEDRSAAQVERLVAHIAIDDDPQHAVMDAVLDTLGPRLAARLRAVPTCAPVRSTASR